VTTLSLPGKLLAWFDPGQADQESEIGLNKIEEGLEVGVAAVPGLLLSTLSDLARKRENLLGCDGGKIAVFAKVVTEPGERSAVWQ
jgi:hypothetical protein